MKKSRLLALVLTLLVVFVVTRRGHDLPAGAPAPGRVPAEVVASRGDVQRTAAQSLAEGGTRQILFGDLHVHSTYSIDAFLYALPLFGGEGAHPPADACDFARYCSSLDFFSINDHAEGITPERWRATIDMLRECDARAGDANNPDLVPFLGWEWTQVGSTPENHYGHKNVVVRGLSDAEVPARPIAFRPESDMARAPQPWQLRAGESAGALVGEPYADFMWWLGRLLAMPACAVGVDTRSLPPDCLESANTPRELFEKLDQWGLDSIVIPHGLAWGIHAPPGARLDNQLSPEQHDPDRQALLEVYSGHGNGEEYRPVLDRPDAGSGGEVCPEPTPDFLPCCWRAGEIMRERCGDLPQAECDARVAAARRLALEAGQTPYEVLPNTTMADWLDCDQCRDCFKPASSLRAGETAQYSLALSRPSGDGTRPLRFRWGFIGSSDNHRARSATGYKQFARRRTTDARGLASERVAGWMDRLSGESALDPREPRSGARDARTFGALFDTEREASFMYPGGLVAVHANGRSRDAIWEGLEARRVYGTSGPRIVLWFDLVNADDGAVPMGAGVSMARTPKFRVRALGSLRQRPGCPDYTIERLGGDRVEALCAGECYYPGDERVPIEAIEVVRVRPQRDAGDPVAPRIEDPWRRFTCPAAGSGCTVEFEDETFLDGDVEGGGDAVYYVRALQEPTPAINGANVRVRFDESGRAVSADPCYGGLRTPASDDCLAPVRERAWSSPIFVDRR